MARDSRKRWRARRARREAQHLDRLLVISRRPEDARRQHSDDSDNSSSDGHTDVALCILDMHGKAVGEHGKRTSASKGTEGEGGQTFCNAGLDERVQALGLHVCGFFTQ
jgi:hypothetical protein